MTHASSHAGAEFITQSTTCQSSNTTHSIAEARDNLIGQVTGSLRDVTGHVLISVELVNTLVLAGQQSSTLLLAVLGDDVNWSQVQQVSLDLSCHSSLAQASHGRATKLISLLLGQSGED